MKIDEDQFPNPAGNEIDSLPDDIELSAGESNDEKQPDDQDQEFSDEDLDFDDVKSPAGSSDERDGESEISTSVFKR